MSEVLRSSFSYQVAVGKTISEYKQVVDIRKSSVTHKSTLPSGTSSRQMTSSGFLPPNSPRSLPSKPCLVPSKWRSIYSWPLPLEPSRLERHTNILRGKFLGLSGSSHANLSPPLVSCSTT